MIKITKIMVTEEIKEANKDQGVVQFKSNLQFKSMLMASTAVRGTIQFKTKTKTRTKVKAKEAITKTIGVTIKTNNRVITHSIGTITKIDNLNREVTKSRELFKLLSKIFYNII